MKKINLIVILIFAAGLSVFAQEETAVSKGNKASIGFGAEFNMNSGNYPELYDFAALGFGAHIGGEYNINNLFTAGLNLSFSFSDFFAFEAAGFFRWYFLKWLPDTAGPLWNVFAQADLDLWAGNDSHSETVKFLGGASAGMRKNIAG